MWRLNNQEFDIKILQSAVDNGGCSDMVQGAIWSDGLSELVECQGNITSFGTLPGTAVKNVFTTQLANVQKRPWQVCA